MSISDRNSKDKAATRRISDITVGVGHRRELGDIDGLAGSIARIGLLHPIVITPANVLIAGERRLAAVKALGWDRVPVTVVNLAAYNVFLPTVRKAHVSDQYITSDFPPADPSVAIGMRATNTARGPPAPPPDGMAATSPTGCELSRSVAPEGGSLPDIWRTF